MKKILIFVIVVCMIFSINSIGVAEAENLPCLSLSKTINDDFGTPYTTNPVTIRAAYDSGSDGNIDKFVKKSWFRVDLLNENVNLTDVYNNNKDKEIIINPQLLWYRKTYRADYKKDITLNGTYIFCGWTTENENPDYIERIDVSEIELERPMAEVNFSLNGDFSEEIIAEAKVSNIECGDDAEIKRYNLVKDYLLPPGSWPDSLAPEYCNEVYDEEIAGHYEGFLKAGLEPEITDNTYQLRDTGSYRLFVEDSKGRYNCISFELPTLESEDTNPPDIKWTPIYFDSANNAAKVKFDIGDDTNIAKVEYAILTDKGMPNSANGTDEYFLENNRIRLNGDTVTAGGTFVVCAVDIYGNTDYERIELSDSTEYPTTDLTMLVYLTFDAKTGTITKCDTSISGDLVIPAEINGVAVTAIGDNAFSRCGELTSVTVPGSISKIGDQAFYACRGLEDVTIWNGVESIGDGAFGACSKLTSILIPESVNAIGDNAFSETSAGLAVYGYGDSYAKTYADENSVVFVDMSLPAPTEEVIPKYPYVIEGLSLLSPSGEELIDIPYDSGFTAEVALNETEERNAEDYIFVAVYGNNGQLLNLDYVKADFIPNTRQSVDFRIPAAGEPIKEIKAFVWDSFGDITPLARSESLRF